MGVTALLGTGTALGVGGTYSLKIVCIVDFFGHKIVHVSRELVLWGSENPSLSLLCCPGVTSTALPCQQEGAAWSQWEPEWHRVKVRISGEVQEPPPLQSEQGPGPPKVHKEGRLDFLLSYEKGVKVP